MAYRDSVGNTYKTVPSAKHPPKQGPGREKRHGRNKRKCERYRSEHRLEKNKARRAARLLRQRKEMI